MYPLHLFLRLETGTGRDDWLLLSVAAAALTTFIGIWLSSGGADQVTLGLRGIISDAVYEIGREEGPVPDLPPGEEETP